MARFFYYGLPPLFFLRFLTGTIWGVFLLAATGYLCLWFLAETKPLTLMQLVLWIDSIPIEAKTSVITSVLTVIGFLVAFHTATMNWKAQALAQLKAQIAGEIEVFYSEASRLTIDARIYVQSLVDAVNTVQSDGPTRAAVFKINYALSQLPKFIATRERLSVMSREVHGILGRHYSVLSSIFGATEMQEECANAFGEITRRMWIRVPYMPEGHPDPVKEFIRQVNITECSEFVSCCETHYDFINSASGAIRGYLLGPLVGASISSVFSLNGKRALLEEAFSKVRNGVRSDGEHVDKEGAARQVGLFP